MVWGELPGSAAWRHHGLREGFEATFLATDRSGYRLDGHTAAVEDGRVWAVRSAISLDQRWMTRTADIEGWSPSGRKHVRLEADGSGRWKVNGLDAAQLEGCLDVDLESSASTNTIPIHRLDLAVGGSAEAPAAYVRALDLRVERLEQSYTRVEDDGPRLQYDYRAPAFDFECRLVYDAAGLVLQYPGIASRIL
jgi:hypothetical protein